MRNLIKNLYNFTIDDREKILKCIEDRLLFEECREPESDGMVHDEWDERVDELSEIISLLEDCETEDDFSEAIEAIDDFQLTYKGLSRLKIE